MLAPAEHVRHVDVDGFTIILDFAADSYLTIDSVGSVFWGILTGRAGLDALDGMAEQFGVERAVLDADLAAFRDKCLADGVLVKAGGRLPVSAAALTARRDANALFCLMATAMRLRWQGLNGTMRHYARLVPSGRSHGLDDVLDRFHFAENFFVSRAAPKDCLPRSLALYRYLLGCGFAAAHVIGVRRVPFYAHAWVEVGARKLLCADGAAFVPISRIEAAGGAF